jgi:16S rRNA (uracil1498-N3)-methyltransferase
LTSVSVGMSCPRFYLSANLWNPRAELDEEESRHCAQVLRLNTGDEIRVFDGCGREAYAKVSQVKKSAVTIEIGEEKLIEKISPQIILAQSVPKGKTMEWIVEKAVELGVSEIQPLITRHTVVKYDADDGKKKAEKWQRVAIEACKQCGQNWLPIIKQPKDFSQWIKQDDAGLKLIASLTNEPRPMKSFLEQMPAQVTILIGPEGDFSQQETVAALDVGYQAITLGDIVMRVETASLFCMSVLRYHSL